MKAPKILATAMLIPLLSGVYLEVSADEPNWRRGRIYYRQVCSACHKSVGHLVSPADLTKLEWASYLEADKHDATGVYSDSVKFYFSTEYRESAKEKNRVVARLMSLADEALFEDVAAYVDYGAKDSDNPARCK